MSTIPTTRESDRFMLRLPDGMRDRIKAAAEANTRSMNAEIVYRLESHETLLEEVSKQAQAWLDLKKSFDEMNKTWSERLTVVSAEAKGLPRGLYDRIQQQAAANKRSVEEEIVQALEAAFPLPQLTFGEHMERLREVLVMVERENFQSALKPFFESLLKTYEQIAEQDPNWTSKRPKYPVPPGGFPMNLDEAEE
jgi:plasmid stability protein